MGRHLCLASVMCDGLAQLDVRRALEFSPSCRLHVTAVEAEDPDQLGRSAHICRL
jgi:hypothetical protein